MILKLIGSALSALILVTRPLLGPSPCCRFQITCTEFSYQQLREQPLHRALYQIILRFCRCQPFARADRTHFE